jgi:hypothetical protein
MLRNCSRLHSCISIHNTCNASLLASRALKISSRPRTERPGQVEGEKSRRWGAGINYRTIARRGNTLYVCLIYLHVHTGTRFYIYRRRNRYSGRSANFSRCQSLLRLPRFIRAVSDRSAGKRVRAASSASQEQKESGCFKTVRAAMKIRGPGPGRRWAPA